MIKQPAQQPPEMAIGPALVNPPSNMISRAPAMNAVIPVMRRITFCLPTGGGSTAIAYYPLTDTYQIYLGRNLNTSRYGIQAMGLRISDAHRPIVMAFFSQVVFLFPLVLYWFTIIIFGGQMDSSTDELHVIVNAVTILILALYILLHSKVRQNEERKLRELDIKEIF